MELYKIAFIFIIMIVVLVFMKKPIWVGALAACLATAVLFMFSPLKTLELTWKALSSQTMIEIISVLYLVELLQHLMQKKGAIAQAENAMLRLFNSRRVNIVLSPIFMGMFPAPNAVLLAAPMVDSAAGDALTKPEKAFATSFYRHVPESSIPLFPALLLAFNVTNLSPALFLLALMPMTLIAIIFPYFTVVRKVPKETGLPPSDNKLLDLKNILIALWPVVLLIVLVLGLHMPTSLVTLAVIVLAFIIYRIKPKEIPHLLKDSFSPPLLLSMVFLLIFKDYVLATNVITLLMDALSSLPIPLFLSFSLVLFITALFGLNNATIAILFPVAFSVIPGSGVPLLVLFMCFNHAAMQIAPTHICLAIACKYFSIDFRDLLIKTLPVVGVFCVSAVLYYLLLVNIF